MKSTRELLGARIKELRRARNYTQEELAEKIGVEPQHLSRLEAGRSYPSLNRLDKISQTLDFPLKDFFEYMHLATPQERVGSITEVAKGLSEDRQKFAYRMMKALQEF